jgi:tetratricopeptide (TPR) repeat protein
MIPPALLATWTPESTRQAAELAALRRMLQASHGCFSLSVAVCNSPALREYLIGELRDAFPGIEVIAVPGGTVDVFGFVREAASDPARSALFLTGLEHSIPSSRQDRPALRSLNASRDLWEERFPCPVVLWLPEYVATLLSVHARDFWRYRSHRFEFVSEHAGGAAGMLDQWSGYTHVAASLPAEEKRFRIAELERRIADAGAQPLPTLIPHVLAWLDELTFLYRFVGDVQHAVQAAQTALEMRRAVGDRRGEAATWHTLATIDFDEGDCAAARDKFNKSLEIKRATGDQSGEAVTWHNLAALDLNEGKYAAAREKLTRSLQIMQAIGDWAGLAAGWHQLATLDLKEANYTAARDRLGKSLEITRSVGDRRGEAAAWHQLAVIDIKTGNHAAAREKFGKSLEIKKAIGDRRGEATTWHNLASIDLDEGKYVVARERFNKVLAMRQAIGDRAGEASTWHNLASVDLLEGNYPAAQEKLGKALAMRQAVGDREGEAATFSQLGALADRIGRSPAGARLVAVSWLIDSETGHGDRDRDWQNLSALCARLGYDQGQIQSMLQEVKAAYQQDRGRGLIEAAFPGGGAGNGVAKE